MSSISQLLVRFWTMFAALITFGLACPSTAQTTGQVPPPPVRVTTDANGVDIVRGTYFPPVQRVLSIGPEGTQGLSLDRIGGPGGLSSLLYAIEDVGGQIVVSFGIYSDGFTPSGNGYVSTEGNGSTLTLVGGIYTYTARDGTVARFAGNAGYQYAFYEGDLARIGSIAYPDGTGITITMKTQTYCPGGYEQNVCQSQLYYVSRVQSVTNPNGYQLKPVYASNTNRIDDTNYAAWGTISDVIAINNAVEACSPSADTCTLTGNWPRQSTATPPPLRVTVTTDSNNRIATATNHGITYSYSYADVGTTRTTTVTDPSSGTRIYVSDTATQRVSSITDELNRSTSYTYDSSGRVTRIVHPEGNATEYSYDARGNVTETRAIAKTGTGLADIVTSAGYDSTCADTRTCNRPNWTRDALNNQTDYTYDPAHGGVLTITRPAATTGAVRPQTRHSYSQIGPIIQLTAVSTCRTNASCTGTADETRTTIAYGNASQNYLPLSVTIESGDTAIAQSRAFTYDDVGNLLTVDGPLSGTGDTTRYRYDSQRRVVGVVTPDPDGSGSRPHLAGRRTFDGDWHVTLEERGTVASPSDTDWAAFSSVQQVATVYDANAFRIAESARSGSTTLAVTHFDYDALGRSRCTARRMDPAQWSGQTDACVAQTTGASGPDRITRNGYDAAGQVVQVQTAYGTSLAGTEVATAYTANGRIAHVIDGEANRTTYVYDGHDRLSRTRYPATTQGSNASSTTDYEELTYDAGSRVTSRRLRDGTSIGLGYDHLGRLVSRDLPGDETDASYAYDLAGRMTAATQGGTVSLAYDALGRTTSTTTAQGTVEYGYDAAGRRNRLDYIDSFYVTYDHDVLGNVTAIRENGASSGVGVLATYAYDALGRRSSVTFGNGTSQTLTFDNADRLTTLANNLAGSSDDLGIDFTYNPANQIASQTRSDDSYAWTPTATDTTDTIDGLNRIIENGLTSVTYDARGNLTAHGSSSYTYSADNQLLTGPNGGGATWDALGRLNRYTATGMTTVRFNYDGIDAIAEVSNGTIARRYVHGPGTDNPIVWYEGSGTSERRFLHSDERGSIVAVTDSSGAVIGINRYDEYGIPASTNIGRFQYTGQQWLAELGLYHYKARMYAPHLGRFMQTDPIGYDAGMNWYAYVGGDPVNFVDPLGLFCTPIFAPNYYRNGEGIHASYQQYYRGTFCFDENSERGFAGSGGGSGGGGWDGFDLRNYGNDLVVTGRPIQGPPDECRTGNFATIGFSPFGTTVFLGAIGASFDAGVQFRIPLTGGWRGAQASLVANAKGMVGAGAFGAIGPSVSGSIDRGSVTPSGFSTSSDSGWTLNGGLAWGAGGEFSTRIIDLDRDFAMGRGAGFGGSGGPRGGYGGYLGVGRTGTVAYSTPAIGCE